MYEAKQHKAAVSHKFSVTEKKSVQQLRMNDNRERSVPQKKRVQGNQSISALQFIKKCDLHNDMGQEFKAKHIAEGSVLQCEQRKITQIFLKQFTITGIKKTVSQNTLCCFALPLFFVRIY